VVVCWSQLCWPLVHGWTVGFTVGAAVGAAVGLTVGAWVGIGVVGRWVGALVQAVVDVRLAWVASQPGTRTSAELDRICAVGPVYPAPVNAKTWFPKRHRSASVDIDWIRRRPVRRSSRGNSTVMTALELPR
jgi:hypothetical protein